LRRFFALRKRNGGMVVGGGSDRNYGLKLHTREVGMVKTKISNTDLGWIFTEKLRSFYDCAPTVSIAIVPCEDGWRAIASRKDIVGHPLCARRIDQVQKQLRSVYVLAKD